VTEKEVKERRAWLASLKVGDLVLVNHAWFDSEVEGGSNDFGIVHKISKSGIHVTYGRRAFKDAPETEARVQKGVFRLESGSASFNASLMKANLDPNYGKYKERA
jgi:hypothetical protein